MGSLPLVSILMSAYNSESYIREAIDSVLSQTYSNWELLVTDDCSSDSTLSILKEYAQMDERIVLFPNQQNRGLTYNLCQMCSHANGKYIARLDADDICRNDRIQKQVAFMEEHGFDIVCSYAKGIGNSSRLMKVPKQGEDLRANLVFYNPIVHSSVMFKNDGSFVYDTTYLKAQDYELWDRMSGEKKSFGVLPEVLVYFRYHRNQISNKCSSEQTANCDKIRKRAVGRLVPNLSDCEKNVFFDWLISGQLASDDDYYTIQKLLEKIEKNNSTIGLYRQRSIKKAINYRKAMLVLSPIQHLQNGSRLILEKVRLFLSAFSINSLKTLAATLLERIR